MSDDVSKSIKSFQQHVRKILQQFSMDTKNADDEFDYEPIIDACNRSYGAVDLLFKSLPVEELHKVYLKKAQNEAQNVIDKMKLELESEPEHRH